MESDAAVRVEHLKKRYGPVTAVDDISFSVRQGEIFGIVGPNGAGKTTLIECLEGIRSPGTGRAQVLGLDPGRDARRLRSRIGVQLQQSALPARMKVWEALDLFASFYEGAPDWRPLLCRLGLDERRTAPFAKLSGGQKQRLFIALALVNDPELVFLDELTTGLDPQARRSMWELVRDLRDKGKTVVLTTHFMEEAERLCDRVLVVDRGRVVALDSPSGLLRMLGWDSTVTFTVEGDCDLAPLAAVPGISQIDREGSRVLVRGSDDLSIVEVVTSMGSGGRRLRDLRTEQPTLEDVFLALTGRQMRD